MAKSARADHAETRYGAGRRTGDVRGGGKGISGVFWRRFTGRQIRVASAAALLAIVCLGYSAQAAIRAIIASQSAPGHNVVRAAGYEAEDHFPGAALLYAADADAAPATGTTGTAALPDLPVPADAAQGMDGTIHPAAPFSMRNASATDRDRALQCLTAAIYYEAANEPDAGQRAVAQVILNRVRHPAFPATVCGVVYQGSERATGCQFSYACDGSMARVPTRASWLRAMRVAAVMLAGAVERDVGTATHYHTYAVTPAWNRQLVMTAAIGAHFFHRWQGYWGTPAAFRQPYLGGEPVPGPHSRAALPLPTSPYAIATANAIAAANAPRPRTAAATIQPAYAQSSLPIAGYAPSRPAADTLPESTILDKWKDSGRPLR
ncbi:cell wall hydrolase [Sphingomonas sp. 28-63-12]|uniref:cell wall hydrolase n=1 Tax=Sphingomonas sp. 28-63-12 TaxID=1970434 RepID=UPI000BDDAEF8|nr:MAG: cell wall hydrolase [Sphingomonas sp. 28-63-12]